MASRSLHFMSTVAWIAVLLIFALGCGDGSQDEAGTLSSRDSGSQPPVPDPPPTDPGTGETSDLLSVDCDVDLGLGPEDAVMLDFMDHERVWEASWEEDALVLTRRYSCGDECTEEETLRIENPLAVCPDRASVRIEVRDVGSPQGQLEVHESTEGTLTLQDWQVSRDGPILVSGQVDAGSRFVFYLDTRED